MKVFSISLVTVSSVRERIYKRQIYIFAERVFENMDIQALGILNSIAMQKKVNGVRTAENDFMELFEKITGRELAGEICNSYNVTLNVGNMANYQQMLDGYDMRGINHVIISPETLSKMEKNPVLKESVLSKIKEFSSLESQKEIQALSPPVKSAGMIIYSDGGALYWLEGYPNEVGHEEDKKIVDESSINKLFQRYSDQGYQGLENDLEPIMQIMATGYKKKEQDRYFIQRIFKMENNQKLILN